MIDNANQILQMTNLIFSLYHRLERQRLEIIQLELRIQYLNNYCNFLINRNNRGHYISIRCFFLIGVNNIYKGNN